MSKFTQIQPAASRPDRNEAHTRC